MVVAALALVAISCTTSNDAFANRRRAAAPPKPTNEWARGAVFYEVFVRSFQDSNGDGIGDFPGLTSRLDYIQNLGADAIWLMPVFQSPSYHGYDITDYETIEGDYGTNADFKTFLDEVHKRGMHVILDFVMNHTSSQHPWFIDSASSSTAMHRDWYVWNATNPGWVQPWGGTYPTWYLKNGAYYYAVFWSEMPDLNFRNPNVKAEMFRLARYWLSQGVDGFRLDATRYLVEDGGGAGQADTPETHQILRDFAADVYATNPRAVLFAENTVDVPTLATYFADNVSNFDFPLATAIIEGVNTGNAGRIRATLRDIVAAYPANALDAPFLTNHDHTRIATQLGNDPGKLRSAAAVLFTLPGAPFVYYGEELGLQNGPTTADESKRTPMPWSASGGFTTGAPWFSYAPGLAVENVESEINDSSSLYTYYHHWIGWRRYITALRDGDLKILDTNSQILAFTRSRPGQRVLVVHNVSNAAADTGPLALDAAALEPIYAECCVGDPAGSPGAWHVSMPPHSSAIFTLR